MLLLVSAGAESSLGTFYIHVVYCIMYIVPSIVLIQLYSEMRRNSTIIQILSTMNNTSWDVFTLQNSKVLATY